MTPPPAVAPEPAPAASAPAPVASAPAPVASAPAPVAGVPAPATAARAREADVRAAGAPTPSAPVSTPAPQTITRSDVARRAVDVFGDSIDLAPPPAVDSAVAEPTWDIDVRSYETQDRVAHYVAAFSGKSKHRIAERLEVGTRYEPMIRAKMRAGGLPEDMYYLALVESGYNVHAYSRAAAVGMWQFMTSTAKGMGMRVDWWVDERRDPVRSTSAAVRFIRGLRDQFGSLYLAAAAYNGGPGRVARGLARYAEAVDTAQQRDDAFFVLAEKDYLRNETREYVPQLIAVALVAKDAARYGMEITPRPAFAYDSVMVPASTPLAAVARAAGVKLAEVQDLNPHFLRGMTPPRQRSLVRVPVGTAARFESGFESLPKEDRVATRLVETKKGETVERLARAHGVSERAIEGFNPKLRRLKSGRLAPGQVVLIPTAAVASAALSVPDPSIEKYAGSNARIRLHTVRRGESVGLIARKYGTTTKRIMELNRLRKPLIFAGQSLIVSGSAKAAGKAKPSARQKGAKSGSGKGAKGEKPARAKKAGAASGAKGQNHSGATPKSGARAKAKPGFRPNRAA